MEAQAIADQTSTYNKTVIDIGGEAIGDLNKLTAFEAMIAKQDEIVERMTSPFTSGCFESLIDNNLSAVLGENRRFVQ